MNRRRILLSAAIVLVTVSLKGQLTDSTLTNLNGGGKADPTVLNGGENCESTLTILFAGDIMGHDMQIASARDDSTGIYSYDSVFKYIRPVIEDADFAIGNLEVTLGGAPYKGYPAFSSPDALAVACKNAGFDALMTANNHSADRGSKGIARTLRVLDSLDIPHTGTWTGPEARDTLTPLILKAKGISVAMLNYTYGTNGIVVPPPRVVSYIDTVRITGDILASREKGADLVVVFIHWGNEYDSLPSPLQQLTANAIFNGGADIIIGSHPHVLQPMHATADSTGLSDPVVWSMGNFVSNQRKRRSDGGAMVRIELKKEGDKTFITGAGYILTWVWSPLENGRRKFFILPCSEFEGNKGFFQSSSAYEAMTLFIKDSRRLLNGSNTGFTELINAGGLWIPLAR
ncbi:MAG TPA: CapA family protein [Bacteroidales bacterium]|nr:CapA family protein [Bacteroidales bacterium]